MISFLVKIESTMQVLFSKFGTKTTLALAAEEFETLAEVMERNFLIPEEGYKFIVLFNGKIANTFLSLKALGVRNGSKIIILQKEIPKPVQFICEFTEEEREANIEESLIEEQCRLADLGFNGWECDQKAPTVLKELYEEEQTALAEEDEEKHNFELFIHGTVVSKPTEICDKPLPRCFLCTDY